MSRYVLYIFPIQILDLLYVLVCPLWLIDSTKFKLHLHKVGNISMSSDISNCFEQRTQLKTGKICHANSHEKNQIEIRSKRFLAYNAREKKMKLSIQFLSTRGSKHYMQCTANCILVEFKARCRTLLQKIFLKMFKKILDMLFST